MSCFVYSEANDIPIDFWNYINFSDESGISEYLSLDDARINIINKRKGNGFFAEIDGTIFVITCFHIIEKNNVKSIIYYYDENNLLQTQNTKIKITIEDFDIAVLELENQRLIPDSIIHRDYEIIHNLSMINLKIDNSTYIETITSSDLIDFIKQKIYVDIKCIDEKKIISSMLYNHEIPCIDVIITRKPLLGGLEGLSGSLVHNNTLPIGMVIMTNGKNKDKEEECITILPISLIVSLVKNFLSKKKQMSSIIFSSQLCEIELDDSVKYENEKIKNSFCNEIYYGNIVSDNHDINYSKAQNKKFKFLQGDIILKINDQYITDDGKVYSSILGVNVKFSTFCLIHGYNNDTFDILYLRNNTIFCCSIRGININDTLPYHINKNPYFLHYEGLVFVELSDKILEFFKEKKITLYGEINTLKCDKVQKYVILVHTNYEYLKKEYKKGYDELEKKNFPYTHNKIFILNKVGNETVTSLVSLRTILMKKRHEKQKTYSYNIMNTNIDEKNAMSITLESTKSFSHFKFVC